MVDDELRERISGITRRIIGCAFDVSNTLGSGFLEKVSRTRWRMKPRALKGALCLANGPRCSRAYCRSVSGSQTCGRQSRKLSAASSRPSRPV